MADKLSKKLHEMIAKLTTKQRKFVECYLSNGENATQAVKDAGYRVNGEKSATVIAAQNLGKLSINSVIRVYKREMAEKIHGKIQYTREDAIREYNEAIEIAKKRGNASAICTAIAGKVELCGLHQEPAKNVNDEPARRAEELHEEYLRQKELEEQARTIQLQVNRRSA